jgi:hypothetical protein
MSDNFEFFKLHTDLTNLTFTNFQNDINIILKKIVIFFKLILDWIANGYGSELDQTKRKYQRWILFTVLISILILIYLFIKYFNLFNINGLEKKLEEKLYLSSGVNDIKDIEQENRKRLNYYNNNPNSNRSYEDRNKDFSVMTKSEIVLILVLSGIFILTFLFFVHRNNPENKIENYEEAKKFFYKSEKFNSEGFKKSLSDPLFNLFKFTGILLGIILLFFILISLVIYCFDQFNITYYILLYLFGFLSIVTIVAIIIKFIPQLNELLQKIAELFKSDEGEQNKETLFDKIKTFILFLPCLLILFAEDVHKDFKLTPSPVFILLIILLLLILSILALPTLYKFINTLNQNDLLSGGGPIYLNNKTILGYYQNLNKKKIYNYNLVVPKEKPDLDKAEQTDNFLKQNGLDFDFLKTVENAYNKDNDNNPDELINLDNNPILKNKIELEKIFRGFTHKLFEKDINGKYNILTKFDPQPESKNKNPYSYTYSLSFYLYLNPQDTNTNISYTEDAEILNYAEKPIIYYNGKSREIIIKSRTFNNKGDQLDTIYRSHDIKYQKWTYFVINYHDNIIDVFIDGKLVASKKNVSPYLVGDYVSVGQNNGIHGSIKDIYYFNMIKPPDDIEFLSKLIKN